MGNIYFYCKKCREKEAIKDFSLCESCNPDNWQPGDKLVAIRDSAHKKWYKKGNVFTIKDFKSKTFHPKEDFRSYDNENFKLYKEEKTMFEKGKEVVWGIRKYIFETYLSKKLDGYDCIVEGDGWHKANSEELKPYVPEPKPKYKIGQKINRVLEYKINGVKENSNPIQYYAINLRNGSPTTFSEEYIDKEMEFVDED
jgi:hypothetical protein